MKVPQIQIMNKIDRLEIAPRIDRDEAGNVRRIWVSAIEKQGLDLIHQVLAEYFKQDLVKGSLSLSPADGRIRALLYGINAVEDEQVSDNGEFVLQISVPRRDLLQMASREAIPEHMLLPEGYVAPLVDAI